jgi:formylglycine-generating enzyme required for sulfatase activity
VFRDLEVAWCPELVVIPAGEFVMGSPPEELERQSYEGPQRRVRIKEPFALGKYAVTFAEFDEFVLEAGHHHQPPAPCGRGRMPVVNVSWEDAHAYCRWLSARTGAVYRLPSEAEWEYACRAGTSTPFWFGATLSTDLANYDGTTHYGSGKVGLNRQRTLPVEEFRPNGFGLHQMHGNVLEWCEDLDQDNYIGAPNDGAAWVASGDSSKRITRGGGWFSKPGWCRSAQRSADDLGRRHIGLGFRVARMLTS